MASKMVTSAVAQEAVNQVLSRFKERYDEQKQSYAKEHIERMEMAHIKLEAALDVSDKWNITSAPLLRWRSKLKRAAQDCDDTLRRYKQRLQEEEEVQQGERSSSFPKRIAHTSRSFIWSIFGRGSDNELTGSTAVRRFEWFADGTSEFLRYVELGGSPRSYMFFDPLIRHIFAGQGTRYCFVHRGQHLSFLLQRVGPPEQGMEGTLTLILDDDNEPENNFCLALILRLSESTDIVGVVVRCLQLFTSHLSTTAEIARIKLTQLPTQDFYWVPGDYSADQIKRWENVHNSFYWKWFQPNPLCCQQQVHHYGQSYGAGSSTRSSSETFSCDTYLEPVRQVYLLGHVALSKGNNIQRATTTRDLEYLKLGWNFWPHGSSEDLLPATGGSASEMINGVAAPAQAGFYANISLEQLGEIMLTRAVDCLRENAAATTSQMLWKSKHGRAYLQVDKTSFRVTATCKDRAGRHQKQRRGKKTLTWTSGIHTSMGLWIRHAPAEVQRSILNCIQKEKRMPVPSLVETTSCLHDCPIKMMYLEDLTFLASRKDRPVIAEETSVDGTILQMVN